MAEYIPELEETEPRYVKKQVTVTAVQWDGTAEAGIKIIKALGSMFVRVLLNDRGKLELELNRNGCWNRQEVPDWIVLKEYEPRLLRVDYEVLSDSDFRKTYERLES